MMEFLEPLFVTGAGSNDVDYSHPAFDEALTAAEAAPALPESCALTNAALRVLLRDVPVVSLWDYISAAARLSASSRAEGMSSVSYFRREKLWGVDGLNPLAIRD
jgi:oligopeptide transport system substrate-binding protein